MGSPANNGFSHFARNKLVNTESSNVASGVVKTTKVGGVKTETFTFTAKAITVTDTGGVNGGQGSLKLCDLPQGLAVILGGSTNLTITAAAGITATASVVGSVGTTAADAANATLTSTEANIVPSTAATLTGSAGAFVGQSTASVTVDGTATAVPIYLNFAVPDAGISANSTITVTGTLTVVYCICGDN